MKPDFWDGCARVYDLTCSDDEDSGEALALKAAGLQLGPLEHLVESNFEADLAAGSPRCADIAIDISGGDLDEAELDFFPQVAGAEKGGVATEDSDDLLFVLSRIRAAAAVVSDQLNAQQPPQLGAREVRAQRQTCDLPERARAAVLAPRTNSE